MLRGLREAERGFMYFIAKDRGWEMLKDVEGLGFDICCLAGRIMGLGWVVCLFGYCVDVEGRV